MTYWVDFSEGGQVRDAGHNRVASFSFINTRAGGRKDPNIVRSQADLFADALNVREATGLTPSQLQARVAELEAALRVSAEYIIKLESFATESGAEAYDIACEEMEAWQEKRRKAGKEIGTQGSLVDGIGWLYERLDELEALRA